MKLPPLPPSIQALVDARRLELLCEAFDASAGMEPRARQQHLRDVAKLLGADARNLAAQARAELERLRGADPRR